VIDLKKKNYWMVSTNKKNARVYIYKFPKRNYHGDAVGGTGATRGNIGGTVSAAKYTSTITVNLHANIINLLLEECPRAFLQVSKY
jgi:hypothetical protein